MAKTVGNAKTLQEKSPLSEALDSINQVSGELNAQIDVLLKKVEPVRLLTPPEDDKDTVSSASSEVVGYVYRLRATLDGILYKVNHAIDEVEV